MVGIGLGVLWIGYTAFAYGNAIRKGAAVSFSDMVLPSHRSHALGLIANAQLPGGGGGGTPGVPGSSQGTVGGVAGTGITNDIIGGAAAAAGTAGGAAGSILKGLVP